MADRQRKWGAHVATGDSVVLRNYAVLAPGERLESDDPETVEVPWDKWTSTDQATGKPWCEVTYGLTADGRDVAEVNKDRQAWQAIRAAAQVDPKFAALVRLFRQSLREVT